MAEAAQAKIRRFGAFQINFEAGELRKNGMRLRLSGQPFQVLAVLVERAGEVVAREELHAKLWPAETFVDFDHGLNNAVARIREVLDDSSTTPRYVETIPRRGYRFIAQLADIRPATLPSPVETKQLPLTEVADLEPAAPSNLPAPKSFAAVPTKAIFVAGFAILALVAALVFYSNTIRSKRQQRIQSIAVLPLKNLSGDPKQEYLADAMTEEVIGRLAGIRDLRVISRTSVMRYKDSTLSAPEIAQTLHVDALVEGSVIREGVRIRVHAQLIRAATDENFWSETYDREMGDVLALQSEVAQAIADKVNVTVTGQERTRLVAARHVSPEVYESYMKAEFGPRNNRADLEQSVAYFEEAIRKDPSFAPAYLGVANAYVDLSAIFVGAPPAEMRPKIIQASRKALELDPELADAHVLLAREYQTRWRWSDAEAEYRRALELKPNDAAAHLGFASWLLCQGRVEEALAWARRARELDPLGTTGMDIGWILFHGRRYDDAVRELRSVLAVHPDSARAHWLLGFALIGRGQPGEAILELEKTASLMHRSPGSIELLATAEAHAGHRTEALRLINELKQRRQKGYIPAGAFINPYLALHDYNEAFSWFERAYAEQSYILQFLKVHPFFDPVRSDPRFQDLVRRVGLR